MISQSGITLAILVLAGAAALECPASHITMANGKTGSIPSGANSMVTLPKGFECAFTFDIPKGYALRAEVTAVYDISPGDSVQFDYFYIITGSVKQVEYAINGPLPITVKSVTGNAKFFANYEFVDVSGYKQKLLPTGTFFNTTLEANTYYTMQAAEGDTATYNLAMLNNGFYDHSLYEVFVFDGNDIMNSEYVGRLDTQLKYFDMHSDTRSFTFVNLYRTPSYSYLLGNDYSKVQKYEQYRVGVLYPTKPTAAYMAAEQWGRDDAYYTYFCDGCDGFYIDTIQFDTKRTSDPAGYVEVSYGSPTQGNAASFKYQFSTTGLSPKQYIKGGVATFHTYKAAVTFQFTAASGQKVLRANRV